MSRIIFELAVNIFIVCVGCLVTYFVFKVDVKFTKRILSINWGGLFPVITYMAFIMAVYTFNFSDLLLQSMMFFMVVFAMIFYILLITKDIKNESVGILRTLMKIGIYAIYICVFFGFVYFSIYNFIGEESFNGNIGKSLYDQIVAFMYFSFISFNTIGYGDITPVDSFTRIIVIIETVMYFIITLYAFSSISIIREKLFEKQNEKSDNDDSTKIENK